MSSELKLSGSAGHRRNIRIETYRYDDTHIQVLAELIDSVPRQGLFKSHIQIIHHMQILLLVDRQLIIEKAEFLTLKAPYRECNSFQVGPEKLVGLTLAKGFTQNALNLYGGVSGCSHILTLLTNLAPAVRQGYVFTYRFPEEEKVMTSDNVLQVVRKMAVDIKDTCQVWKSDSSVQKDLEQGEMRDLPQRLYPSFWRRNKNKIKR